LKSQKALGSQNAQTHYCELLGFWLMRVVCLLKSPKVVSLKVAKNSNKQVLRGLCRNLLFFKLFNIIHVTSSISLSTRNKFKPKVIFLARVMNMCVPLNTFYLL
jgi:hypothetical protein